MTELHGNLWVLAFDDQYKADEARALFRRMAGEGLMTLEETAVVIVGPDGKASLTQDVDKAGDRRHKGHLVGLLAAAVTGVMPMIMVGTLTGAVVGRLTDHGITTQMMKPIADSLKPGTSALFLLGSGTSDANGRAIVERVKHFQPTIVQTTVSPELRQEMEQLLASAPEAPAS